MLFPVIVEVVVIFIGRDIVFFSCPFLRQGIRSVIVVFLFVCWLYLACYLFISFVVVVVVVFFVSTTPEETFRTDREKRVAIIVSYK